MRDKEGVNIKVRLNQAPSEPLSKAEVAEALLPTVTLSWCEKDMA